MGGSIGIEVRVTTWKEGIGEKSGRRNEEDMGEKAKGCMLRTLKRCW
ncbi:hypothetical protein HYU14_01740 [Candidatus Woesearchaeota archaeon]|nr:hypothetical protein [Candidatus Woesearchaeota archaeon]